MKRGRHKQVPIETAPAVVHLHFRLCHSCFFLNEASDEISRCQKCRKDFSAQDEPDEHVEMPLVADDPEELAAEHFDKDDDEEEEDEQVEAASEEEEEESSEANPFDFSVTPADLAQARAIALRRQRVPRLAGLCVRW